MAGYSRQSIADIIANAIIKAAPINAELNALRDAFALSTGHRHDGSATEGSYVPLISDSDSRNRVVVDTANNRISFFVEVGSTAVEQLRIQDGVVVPVTNNDIDLGSAGAKFKDIYIDGIGYVDNIQILENATVAGTLAVTGLTTLASTDINGGTIDGTVIGATSAQAITGTTITATTGLTGTLTGNVTGNLTGNSAGTHTGAVIGNVTGNVTSSGTSSFADVTISGSLDMNSGTSSTVTGLSAPVNGTDATTKTYVDTADNLKLNLAGGTMSGAIAMGGNKVTGLGTPTSTADAATKGYVDTAVSGLIDAAPGALDTLNELAAAIGDDANFSTTVTNSIASKLALAGGTMTGDIVLGANKATSTATPTTNDTLTRKGYVDTQDALKLNLSGGTMSGAIAMGTSKITGMGDPTSAQDAATKTYVDTADNLKLNLSGGTMSGNLVMGSNKVTSTATPTTNDDLTRKGYVDGILGSATAAATSAAAALVSETAAAGSASSALTSANNAAASYDSFDDRYLGPKASAPSVDNDGNTLLVGAIYWNTTTSNLFVWTGSAWNAAAFDTGSLGTMATQNANAVAITGGSAALTGVSSVTVSSSSTALAINQTGTGAALLVEDSASPDSTPFIIDTAGNVGIGTLTPSSLLNVYNATDSTALISGDGTVATTLSRASNNIGAGQLNFRKYRGTLAVPLAVVTGDNIGTSNYSAWDGSSLLTIAQVAAAVDTFTGVNDVSSNLKFLTRPTGSGAALAERLRIGPAGQFGIGGANYGTSGQTIVSGGSTAAPAWGTLPVAGGGTGVTTSTGSGAVVLNISPSIAALTLTSSVTETIFAITGTTPALSAANGTIQTWTLTANSTPTDSLANGQSITLLIDDGTAYTITWPSVTWKTNGGVAPTLNTTGVTAIVLWEVGGVLYGARVGDA
jgi:hypothetical protein